MANGLQVEIPAGVFEGEEKYPLGFTVEGLEKDAERFPDGTPERQMVDNLLLAFRAAMRARTPEREEECRNAENRLHEAAEELMDATEAVRIAVAFLLDGNEGDPERELETFAFKQTAFRRELDKALAVLGREES